MKKVKAWALVSGKNGGFYAYWTFDNKKDLSDPATFHRKGSNGVKLPGDRWIQVWITPAGKKKKSSPSQIKAKTNK